MADFWYDEKGTPTTKGRITVAIGLAVLFVLVAVINR